jgi:CheY-like chemotaxis protein
MPDGGHFTIRARNVSLGPGHSLPPGRYVHLSFEDTGRGIAPEHLPRVFEPYFTTHKRRSGLGLAVAHSIIRKHDGEISVESEPGHGAVFHVRLPAVRPATEASSAPPPAPAGPAVRVLVMDDEEPILRLLENVLTDEGFEVATARDGAGAVRLFQTARDEDRPFGLVILDLTVPGGMGGLEALHRLRAIEPAVRAIVSSGYSADEALARHREHGFAGVIPKPYRVADVLEVVREVLCPARPGS